MDCRSGRKINNGTLANIFDLQESFARDIAGELNVVLADPSEARIVDKRPITRRPTHFSSRRKP